MRTAQGHLCLRCGDLIAPGRDCPTCKTALEVRRAIYDSGRWRTYTRPIVLDRDQGICQLCGEPGAIVDHVLPIETLLELGADPFNPAECQTLCARCSGSKDGGRRLSAQPGTMLA